MSCASYRAFELYESPAGVRGRFATLGAEALGEGDALVRITHSSVNFKDALAASGKAPIARTLPLIGGCNASGILVESGESGLPEGTAVTVVGATLSEKHPGGYAEYMRVPSAWLQPLPEGMSLWASMAIGTAGLTAAMAIDKLEKAGLTPSAGPVAVSGASGGSGSLAVAMLAHKGYEVTAITGKESSHDYLRSLGAAEVIGRPEPSSRPLEHAHWAGAVDTVGGPMLSWLLRTTNVGGSIAAFGNAGGNDLPITVLPFILRGVNLLGVSVSFPEPAYRQRMWEAVAESLPEPLLAQITATVPFEELPGALESLIEGKVQGRIVVEISKP